MKVNGPLDRICARCKKEILYSTPFSRYQAEKRQSLCMTCSRLPKFKRDKPFSKDTKICAKCFEEKTVSCFYKGTSSLDGLYSLCKVCSDEKRKQWGLDNPEKIKEMTRRDYVRNGDSLRQKSKEFREANKPTVRLYNMKKYDLNPDQLQHVLSFQDSPCSACGKILKAVGKGMGNGCIDHDHSNNKFRSILCQHCNKLIGLAKESPEVLRGCIEYLLKWAENQNWLDFVKQAHSPAEDSE